MTDYTFTAANYLEIRQRGVGLHSKIFKKLTNDDIKTCGKHLGVWQQKSLALESDNEVDLFTDYTIYGYHPHGFNMAVKYLRLFHKEANGFELELLQRMRLAHYAIYQVEETNHLDTLKVVDVFSKVIYKLVDQQLAKTAYQGLIFAGYLIDFSVFTIQTGGTVLITKEILQSDEVTRVIDRIDDEDQAHFLNNPANGSKLARAVLFTTFKLGQAKNFGHNAL